MPFLFIVVGLVMIVSSVKGTNQQLVKLLKSDFTGKGNFIYWSLAILAIGAVGYIQELKPVSRAFLVLVVIVLFLENKGVFTEFSQAIATTQQPTTPSTQQLGTLTSGLTNMQSTQF
jgi:hypothetical protein